MPYNNILVHKNFEKDLLYIGLGEKYTYWNVFPKEDKNSQFLYYLSTVGNTSEKFEDIYYELDCKKGRTLNYNNQDFHIKKKSEKNVAPDSEDFRSQFCSKICVRFHEIRLDRKSTRLNSSHP